MFLVLFLSQAPAPPGKLVDIGGRRVHLYCTGTGAPTVMIVGGGFSVDWGLVQPEIAKLTRVCTYDPSGTAWSDPGPEQTCPVRVDEVHKLLKSAGIEGPHVLVGLSIGGLVARLYASQYASEVAGVVIVDHAFIDIGSNKSTTPASDTQPVLISQAPIVLTVEDTSHFDNLPKRNRDFHRWAMSLKPALPTPEIAEACYSEVERQPTPLGDVPVAVVSTANDAPNYSKLQVKLLSLSSNSTHFIATKSFHAIEIDQPDIVVNAIHEIVEAARKARR